MNIFFGLDSIYKSMRVKLIIKFILNNSMDFIKSLKDLTYLYKTKSFICEILADLVYDQRNTFVHIKGNHLVTFYYLITLLS